MTDIIYNDIYVGKTGEAEKFTINFRKARRKGEISIENNIHLDKFRDVIYVDSTPGRVRRPLIVVENGNSKLTADIVEKIKVGEYSYADLVEKGIVEYIDAMEEEDLLIAISEEELTIENTHLEIAPITMFGINTGTVSFLFL
jgi:DNA-directed RNA polymerase subunit B'